MSKTIADVASQIADAIMDAIERRNGIIKDDITEAARGVLAKNQSGSNPYNPYIGMIQPSFFPPPPSPVKIIGCNVEGDGGVIWSLPNGSP